MQIIVFTLVAFCFIVELKAADEILPAVISRNPFGFLDKASSATKDEYIRLYKDRKTPRKELQTKKDELIAKESEEIQKLYADQKSFEAKRKAQHHDGHLLQLSKQTKDKNFHHFAEKAHEIINDDSLSIDQACDKIILLKYHSGSQATDGYLRIYNCKPLDMPQNTPEIR